MTLKNTISLSLTLFLSLASVTSEAYSWKSCEGKKQRWEPARATMYMSTTSMPVGSAWDLKAQYKMSEWRDVPGSSFKFYISRDTDGSSNTNNSRNEVYFSNKPNESDAGTTFLRYKCWRALGKTHNEILEADIRLNSRYSWTNADMIGNSHTSGTYNYQLVIMHELGHALGLLHSDNKLATMNTNTPNGGVFGLYNRSTPHSDDRSGIRYLYPDSSTGRDVAASRFKNSGGGTAKGNRVTNGNGMYFSTLKRGSSYKMEYSLENLGVESESVRVQFYISTNNYISTGDRYLGSITWNIPKGNQVNGALKSFTVPTDLAVGKYYVGYIVDPQNNIPETTENDNYVAHATSINVM